jgi:hypothetical protein
MPDELLFYVIVPIGSTLVGVAIGAVATYYGSLRIFQRQQNTERATIAKGFLSEIEGIERSLLPTINDNFLQTDENPIMWNLFKHIRIDLQWGRSFYDDYGLFFTSRREIYHFDEELVRELERFYSNLLVSEEYRYNFMENNDFNLFSHARPNDKADYKEIVGAIKHTCEVIPEIKTKLNIYILSLENENNLYSFMKDIFNSIF